MPDQIFGGAPIPLDSEATVSVFCPLWKDLYVATSLVFDGGFETPFVSCNSTRVRCGQHCVTLDDDLDGRGPGCDAWNLYRGDLGVLRQTGEYTQLPGSNPEAEHHCGLTSTGIPDTGTPAPGEAAFFLVTGLSGGVEDGLGEGPGGGERPRTRPCGAI